MNKKGFTLVELLAVIAIVVILVVIAIPNILKMFNNAKESAFETEVKEIAKTAEKQWLKDSIYDSSSKVYSKCSDGTCTNPLDMNTSDDLEYYVNMDSQGKINQMYVKDNSFQYVLEGEFDINNITGIKKTSDIDESEKITISGDDVIIGDPSNYTIKFDPAEGTVSETIRLVQPGNRLGTVSKPTKSGSYFMGWMDEKTGEFYYATTIPTKSVTLTAQWSNKNYVARIGSNYYSTIQGAVDAANPGDEVVILVNLWGANFTNNKKITVNLNSITLSTFKVINEEEGDLTLINGGVNRTYTSGDNYIIKNNGRLSIGNPGKNDGISIVNSASSSISYSSYYLYGITCGPNSTTIINSGTISSRATAKTGGNPYGIYCGTSGSNCEIIVNGGNINASTISGYGYGIFSYGNVNVNGGKIAGGAYGIYGKNVEINGGEISAEGKRVKNSDNTYTLNHGYGIYSTENTTIKSGTITVTGAASSNGIYSKGSVTLLNSTLSSTGKSYDTSSASGINATGDISLTNSTVTVNRPKNSNSQSTVTVGTDALGLYGNSITVTNSTVNVVGKGKSSSTIGIKARKDITFNSGNISVNAAISGTGVRGLETTSDNDGNVIINGGSITVRSEDASKTYGVYCSTSKNDNITFNDGTIKVKGTNTSYVYGFMGYKNLNVKSGKKINETTDAEGYKVFTLVNQ